MYISVTSIVSNAEKLYDGNLKHYFKIIFNAPNIDAPYHNFRHMMHITWHVHDAIRYYGDFDKRRARALLIAAMFHDYGHKGVMGNDFENIAKAKSAIRCYILEEDKDLLSEIEGLISVTEFPHADCEPTRSAKILRDADMSPIFDNVWLQEVIFGLAKEFGLDCVSFLEQQLQFVPAIKFNTDWAQERFEQRKVERIAEIKELLEIVK